MSEELQRRQIDELRAAVSQLLDKLDPDTPIAGTVVFRVGGKSERDFVSNISVLTEATRRLPGCNVFAYHKTMPGKPEQDDSVGYLIYEDWETVNLFRRQWNSQHLRHFQDLVGNFVVALPDLKFHYGWSDAGTAGHIPKTGQKLCWNSSGQPVKCDGTGQDGNIQAGVMWPLPRFTDGHDGTVTDRLTGLVWLKDADGFGEVTWEQALANARNLAAGQYGLSDGSNPGDWRLPTIRELFSLIDYGAGNPIIPAEHQFKNVRSSIYWTSTSLAAAPTLAWMMTLGIGPTVFDLKINPNRMWPVRSVQKSRVPQTGQRTCFGVDGKEIPCKGTGQDGETQAGMPWPDPRFTDNGDGTVTDNLTSLIWLKNANPFGMRIWEQALEDCNTLASGSYGLRDGSKAGDWHLPSIKEIESLVDYGAYAPCLPDHGVAFTGVRPSSYWTSTSVAIAPAEAMFIILGVGPAIFESKEHPFFVWPVRSSRPVR